MTTIPCIQKNGETRHLLRSNSCLVVKVYLKFNDEGSNNSGAASIELFAGGGPRKVDVWIGGRLRRYQMGVKLEGLTPK